MEGLFPSLNPVPAPLQVTAVPLLRRDAAEILVPVLLHWRCFRGAQAAMECDCYNVLDARGSVLFPPLVMQRCMMQMAQRSGRWVVRELSHHTRTEPQQLLVWGLEREQEKLFPLELFSSSLSYFSTCDS